MLRSAICVVSLTMATWMVWPSGLALAADTLSCDLTQSYDLEKLQFFGGDIPTRYCQQDTTGIRIKIPSDADLESCGIETRFTLRGNFILSGEYSVINLPRPPSGFGAGLTLALVAKDGKAASLQRIHRQEGDQVFVAHRAQKDPKGKTQHTVELQNAKNSRGKLRIRREGQKLEYFVVDGEGADFTKIWETDFSSADVSQLHFGAQTGKSPAAVEVAWKNIEIVADEFIATTSVQQGSSRFVWLCMLAGIVVAVAVAGVTFYHLRKQ